jgi:hypothetical protein
MIEMVRKYPGEITIIEGRPFTNIALVDPSTGTQLTAELLNQLADVAPPAMGEVIRTLGHGFPLWDEITGAIWLDPHLINEQEPLYVDYNTAFGPGYGDTLSWSESTIEENSVQGQVDAIKLDCIAHQYPMVRGVEEIEGVRILAVEDIAAMKLNAIANRGTKKDFWDLRELSLHFDREQLFSFYEKKYPSGSCWGCEKSLSYFVDADGEPDPFCLKGLSWAQVKSDIAE